MASTVTPRHNLKEAEELASSLGEALSSGDSEEAVQLSRKLAQLSVPVSVSISSQAYPQDGIRLKVGVEDAQSDSCIPVTLEVSPAMTIAQLKDKVLITCMQVVFTLYCPNQINQDFGFHPLLQRWVIGKRLAQDQSTLYSHGIRSNGDQAFLFICSASSVHLTRHHHNLDQEQQLLNNIVGSISPMELHSKGFGGNAAEKKAPPTAAAPAVPPKTYKSTKPPVPPKPQPGWACEKCTYVNKPTRPGCEMCGDERPQDYQVPDLYQPDQEEIERLELAELSILQYEEAQQEEREQNYLNLLATDEQNLIVNATEADCPICFSPLQPGDGVMLRECLHTFCRECLIGTIINSNDAEVSCPDDCESKLLDREIKELLTEEEHQRFLELRLSIAESRSEHSFHCQTPNCKGWCIYEDEVNEFPCGLCLEINCLLCRAIHKGMNCKDYQDDLRVRAQNDKAAQQTKQMLESMLQNGEAMNCPRCAVIVQKKDGCDWICCLMCKTEICWVTKQARWGPNGHGDTSGGCRCRVNNQPCHPNCQNCH